MSWVIYAHDFINGSPKSYLPFFSRASLKVHEEVSKYRECFTIIRLNPNTSGKKWSSLNRLSAQYAKFQMHSMKWHSFDAKKRRKHVPLFWQYIPTMEQKL